MAFGWLSSFSACGLQKEKGPRIVAKVLCEVPFASDYFTGMGFW